MANHKRKRPKHQRAGCLFCKPHKDERRAKKPRAKQEAGVRVEWRRLEPLFYGAQTIDQSMSLASEGLAEDYEY